MIESVEEMKRLLHDISGHLKGSGKAIAKLKRLSALATTLSLTLVQNCR